MAVSLSVPKLGGRSSRASLREVCLLGPGALKSVAEGDRLTWSGRDYRVASAEDRAGYLHVVSDPPGGG